ncbi:MAG TPA: tail fiber domain-containing protein [Prolixibacteraceae bacterium]|nr:tail fiber domain-containing protein [Prolixibacteraceae bacterium]
MKRILIVLIAVLFTTGLVNAQINVDCNGNVGIGGSPSSSYKLDINGGVRISGSGSSVIIDHSGYSNSGRISGVANMDGCYQVSSYHFVTLSDERLKENIQDISNGLDLILKLNGKRYDYKTDPKDGKKLNELKKNHAGFLAQEVAKVIPEAVLHDDSTDLYSIDYTKIIPFITEAMKEQQTIIENLEAQILELKANSANSLKNGIMPGAYDDQNVRVNELQQNSPNPFSQTTTIGYSLADNVQKAMICIYDMNGAQLKCIPLNITTTGNITIIGNELKPGMYMYSLITDGQLVDTKRMVLTE